LKVLRNVSAFAAGLAFGIGLIVSGMTRPSKVLAFLDVFGDWDPSLLFVMGGAVGVYAIGYGLRREKPIAADAFAVPSTGKVDARLLLGAAVFGVGWGISGYCPGPAVVSLGAGSIGVFVFLACVLAGMALTRLFEARANSG
jgi:uncharacterized protein